MRGSNQSGKSAWIASRGGMTSHAAVVALAELALPGVDQLPPAGGGLECAVAIDHVAAELGRLAIPVRRTVKGALVATLPLYLNALYALGIGLGLVFQRVPRASRTSPSD